MTFLTSHVRATAVLGAFSLALALAGCSSDGATPGTPSPSAPPAEQSAAAAPGAGQTLPARWWSWAAAAPDAQSPVADGTGEFCALNQPDDVFFLAGTFGETGVKRACTVPAGKPVYVPVVNKVCTVTHGQPAATAIKACRIVDPTRVQAEVDGKPVAVEEAGSGGVFTLTAANGSAFADMAGDVVAWGIWAGPLRLSPGRHSLEIAADTMQFSVGVTYSLTVT